MGLKHIPVMVKRVAMAVWRKRAVHTFPAALALARAQLTKYGYLVRGSDSGPDEHIQMTADGRRKERDHRRKAAKDSLEFDRLYEHFKLDEKGGNEKPPEDVEGR